MFNLAELGAKPVGQTVPRDSMAVSQGDDRGRRFQIHADHVVVSVRVRSIRPKEADRFRFFPRLTRRGGNLLEDSVLETDEPALEELENPQSVLGSLHEPNGESWKEEARVRLRQEGPAAKQPVSPESEGLQPPPIGKQHRNSALHRRPVLSAIGAVLLASVLGGGSDKR